MKKVLKFKKGEIFPLDLYKDLPIELESRGIFGLYIIKKDFTVTIETKKKKSSSLRSGK